MRKLIRTLLPFMLLTAFAFILRADPFAAEVKHTDRTAEQETQGTFKLPASLRFIDEEAFEGTAAAAVYVPESVEHIADDAFEGVDDLTVYGAENSEAEAWAARNGHAFVIREVLAEPATWTNSLQNLVCFLLLALIPSVIDQGEKQKRHGAVEAIETTAMYHRRRAELFVRALCFP